MAQATTFNGQWGALFSHPADIDNTDNGFRINNAVKYVSPKFYGLQAEAMYAFGGQAGAFSSQSTVGGGLSFSSGPLYVGAGYFYAKDPAVQFNDGNFVGNSTPPSLAAAPTDGIWGLVGSPSNMQVISAGATYTLGPVLFGGNFSNVRFDNAKGVGGNTVWFNSYELWGQYSLTPAATLGAGYTFTNGKDNGTGQRPKYGQVNAIADYALSKRTDVYLLGSYQHAMSGGVTADIYSGLFAGGASTTTNQVSARVAIRHKF
jgi:predicted porin